MLHQPYAQGHSEAYKRFYADPVDDTPSSTAPRRPATPGSQSDTVEALACSVIHRAVEDYLVSLGRFTVAKMFAVNQADAAEVRRFLLDEDGPWADMRAYWCDLASLDPHTLREQALAEFPKALRGVTPHKAKVKAGTRRKRRQ